MELILLKKVLFIIPTLGEGGAERVLVNLVNNLDSSKFDITVFSIFDRGVNRKYLNENIKYRYFFKKLFRGNIHFFKLFKPEFLYKIMIKDKYDIVVSYLEGPSTRIVSGCTDQNTVLFNWVHTDIYNSKVITQSYRSHKEVVERYKKFHSTVFVSNTVKDSFVNIFGYLSANYKVKYNTVDTSTIISKSNELIDDVHFVKDTVNLVSVGTFKEKKGFMRLLNIVKRLLDKGLSIHLYLLGKGDQEEMYREYINKNSMNNNVTIVGFKKNPYKYVKACDLFVCSSYSEGYSTAVTESLIVGTPVITTKCSGMEEMLGANEYGVIVPNDDEELYKGMYEILANKEKLAHYKQKAIERGRYFNKENTIKSVEELFENIKG